MILYFLICLLLSSFVLYYEQYLLILVIGYLLYLMSKAYYKYALLTILSMIIFNTYLFNYALKPKPIHDHRFKVVETKQYSYYVANKEGKVLLKTSSKLNKGDLIEVKGRIKEVNSLRNESLFNYDDYLKSIGIFYQIKSNDIKIINKASKEKKPDSKIDRYFNYMFLMDKEGISKEIIEALKDLTIIHIIVVSGFHFNMLKKLLQIILSFISNHYVQNLLIYSLLFGYLYILDFTIPALRMYLYLLLCLFNKQSKIVNHCISCLILLIINPLNILSTSYLLSVYVNAVILLMPFVIKKKYLLNQIFLYFYMLPLNLMMNFQLTVFGVIYNIVFSFIINVIYVLLILAKLFGFLQPLAIFVLEMFEKLLLALNEYNVTLVLGVLPIGIFIGYFILLLWITKMSYKYQYGYSSLVLIIILIIVYYYIPNIEGYVAFINVGQGDCIIIKAPFTDEAMMIDVAKPYKQNTVYNVILPFLKAHKIKSLKYLVITHDDIDHSGGKEDLLANFKVQKVIESKHPNIKYGPYLFVDLLARKHFDDKNSNAITLYARINNLNYFFAADITQEAEYELASLVKSLPIDILKVAHHGSKTSTSDKFLDLSNPKIAIISAGIDNRYHHPHLEVLKRLSWRGIYTYKTFTNGTIKISNIFIRNWLTTTK